MIAKPGTLDGPGSINFNPKFGDDSILGHLVGFRWWLKMADELVGPPAEKPNPPPADSTQPTIKQRPLLGPIPICFKYNENTMNRYETRPL